MLTEFFLMDNIAILQAVVLIVLLILSSFFSSAETALTTVNLIRIGILLVMSVIFMFSMHVPLTNLPQK